MGNAFMCDVCGEGKFGEPIHMPVPDGKVVIIHAGEKLKINNQIDLCMNCAKKILDNLKEKNNATEVKRDDSKDNI